VQIHHQVIGGVLNELLYDIGFLGVKGGKVAINVETSLIVPDVVDPTPGIYNWNNIISVILYGY
jgi:hypothetical protein